MGDQQARYLDLATSLRQLLPAFRVVLSVTRLNIQPEPGDFLTYLDAERTGTRLVERELTSRHVDTRLLLGTPLNGFGCGKLFADQHDGRQHQPHAAEEITYYKLHETP